MTRRRVPHIPPRWETPRSRRVAGSYGPLVVAWARELLGLDLGGWQAYALGRLLEHDAAGELVARVALTGTARQNGKTVRKRALIGWGLTATSWWPLLVSAATDRAQARIPYDQVYDDFAAELRLRRVAHLTKHRGITTPGRLYRPLSADTQAMRGLSPAYIDWDELLTQRTWSMWAALRPAMIAQRRGLMDCTSTAGDERSIVLRDLFDRGRAMAEGTLRPDPAFLMLWWAAPDAATERAEPTRDELVAANPAIVSGRIGVADVRSEWRSTSDQATRVRERLNLWADQASSPFAPGSWAACRVEGRPLADTSGPYVVAVDAVSSWERASIAVAGVRPDGRVGVEIARDLRLDPMTGRAVDDGAIVRALDELRARATVRAIRYDAQASIAPVLARYAESHDDAGVAAVGPAEFARDCADLEEHVLGRRLAHADPLIDAQLAGAVRLLRGDGWRWGRRASSGHIDALCAATLAVAGAARPVTVPVPQIF